MGFSLGNHTVDAIAYVDDLMVLASSAEELQSEPVNLISSFSRSGLKLNVKK